MEVRIVIDGQTFELPADTDPDELRTRVAQAVFRCEVEQLYLADGYTMLVNWRSVRTIQIRTGPASPNHPDTGTATAPTGEPPVP
ncbi:MULTISPECIES: hypothetical protein [unclassified Pseudofrankia]|uniref:hypothetical protein n=1 Tax=unclassified Pseudofrankia TaxID=2994372 RepID=UPI0008D8E1C9|nr:MULTISPECIES: hypothetical protein [unclassified Pseudofrankia]MDT3438702.1 hypothetical protein [Pseudofrankia sp. BMG5.37]OHV56369.1 hypothetical protein BCD48_07680 [Pseudofrankia sp. BMG5.36]